MAALNKECQLPEDRLQAEIQEAQAKKQRLEEALKALEAASEHHIDAAARQEIEDHKNRRPLSSGIPNPRTDWNKPSG